VMHPLATWDDILRADLSHRFDIEDRKQIEAFLADPIAWSTLHGGRSALLPRKK
jgi:orotate phosphoribosyltransferase